MAKSKKTFGYCLNTSTIRGQGLSLPEAVQIAARAGYKGIEPWIRELDAYVEAGGELAELGARIADLGLSVENVIGFFAWASDDEAQRRAGLEEARRNMAQVRAIGGKRLAAPPFGITDAAPIDLHVLAERYRALLEIGEAMGVVPMVEFWGASRNLSRLSEAVFVAHESAHHDACVLADIFHMYKAGCPFTGIRLLGPQTLGLLHINDYPAQPPRETITDAERVYPGDGIVPFNQILQDLHASGYRGMLSLELFNRQYWQLDPLNVARTGLLKTRALIIAALNGDDLP